MRYIYRNYALEYLFSDKKYVFSPYGDLSLPKNINEFSSLMFFNMLPREYDIELLKTWIEDYHKNIKKTAELYPKPIYVIKLQNYHFRNNIFKDNSFQEALDRFNNSIYSLGSNVYPIDINDFEKKDLINPRYFYAYNTLINPKYNKEFAEFIEKQINLFHKIPKKCLILDLDNTLWGGILGEDGIGNLKISGGYPGNAYNDFQKLILSVKNIGVILCLASENNEDEVVECFEKRDDMVLKLDDFTVRRISWQTKDKSLKQIAAELNISLDSMVFIDDNIFERELVKNLCPGVEILDFPEDLYLLPEYYSKEFHQLFSKNSLSKEDKNRTELYQHKFMAEKTKGSFSSADEYIKSLNMIIRYDKLSEININRIAELINKTNQFNLTTKRYSVEDISSLQATSMISAVSVSDKFGNLGIVGCAIVKINKDCAEIDSFMLSCRVLGRNIEFEYMQHIINELALAGVKKIKAPYIPTVKNAQVKDFYPNCGFKKISEGNGTIQHEMVINNERKN